MGRQRWRQTIGSARSVRRLTKGYWLRLVSDSVGSLMWANFGCMTSKGSGGKSRHCYAIMWIARCKKVTLLLQISKQLHEGWQSHAQGRFPFEKLMKFYSLDQINQAAQELLAFSSRLSCLQRQQTNCRMPFSYPIRWPREEDAPSISSRTTSRNR